MKFKTPRKNSGRQPLCEAFNSSVKGLMLGSADQKSVHCMHGAGYTCIIKGRYPFGILWIWYAFLGHEEERNFNQVDYCLVSASKPYTYGRDALEYFHYEVPINFCTLK